MGSRLTVCRCAMQAFYSAVVVNSKLDYFWEGGLLWKHHHIQWRSSFLVAFCYTGLNAARFGHFGLLQTILPYIIILIGIWTGIEPKKITAHFDRWLDNEIFYTKFKHLFNISFQPAQCYMMPITLFNDDDDDLYLNC